MNSEDLKELRILILTTRTPSRRSQIKRPKSIPSSCGITYMYILGIGFAIGTVVSDLKGKNRIKQDYISGILIFRDFLSATDLGSGIWSAKTGCW